MFRFVSFVSMLVCSSAAYADSHCLSVAIEGNEYPAIRSAIIQEGWLPEKFDPPFENAPFTEWVKIRNYQEVDACAPTGAAPCKFVFRSALNADKILNVFTSGEEIGIVTGHECFAKDNDPLVQVDATLKTPEDPNLKAVPVLERPSKGDGLNCTAGTIIIPSNLADGSSVKVRVGPSFKHRSITELLAGDFVFVFEKRAHWYGVVVEDSI